MVLESRDLLCVYMYFYAVYNEMYCIIFTGVKMHAATKIKRILADKHGEVGAKHMWYLRCQCDIITKYRGAKRHPVPCGHAAACPQCKCQDCLCWRALGRKKKNTIHLSICPDYDGD